MTTIALAKGLSEEDSALRGPDWKAAQNGLMNVPDWYGRPLCVAR
jgi:hypothetical protein